MKAVFIGCVRFSAMALGLLLNHRDVEIVGVVTREQSPFNADFEDLRPMAEQAGCPVFLSDGKNQAAMADWIRAKGPDLVFCIGWSQLLPPALLALPPLGVVGYHPAELPRNRGRHPLIWALALGLKQTASTFFMMDKGADSGDIVSQRPVLILEDDDAENLYSKIIDTALPQLDALVSELATGKARRSPQDNRLANYWRKRTPADGQIDWRMPAKGIHNLIRALARPYPGAHCMYRGKASRVWKSRVIDGAEFNLEPGKILGLHGNTIQVKCGEGAIELIEHELDPLPEPGTYL